MGPLLKMIASSAATLLAGTASMSCGRIDVTRRMRILFVASVIAAYANPVGAGEGPPEEYERRMTRGDLLMAKAQSPDDFKRAVVEFEAAVRSAATADAYRSLGHAQEKARMFREAMSSYRSYLSMRPDSADAGEIRRKIYALELSAEEEARPDFSGVWARELGGDLVDHFRIERSGEGWQGVQGEAPLVVSADGRRLRIHIDPAFGGYHTTYWDLTLAEDGRTLRGSFEERQSSEQKRAMQQRGLEMTGSLERGMATFKKR